MQSQLRLPRPRRTGLNGYFTFVAALCCVLCFFAAYLSFMANVAENSVEFGVLRSLGLSTRQVQRVYVYEALAVVLTAFLLGTAIGVALATALTVQQNLFTENVRRGWRLALGRHPSFPAAIGTPALQAFVFVFPAPLFGFTLGACVVMAVVASYYPTRALARLPISGVLKGRAS